MNINPKNFSLQSQFQFGFTEKYTISSFQNCFYFSFMYSGSKVYLKKNHYFQKYFQDFYGEIFF